MTNTYVQKVIDKVDVSDVIKKYDSITELDKWGQFAMQAGLIPPGTSLPQAMAIIQTGKEIGLQPMQSLRSMNFIKGRLTMSVQLQLALAKQRGVRITEMVEEENHCRITLERNGESVTCSYSLDDAKKAGLVKQDGNYEKYLKQMLRWRATGDCLKMIAPDLVMGLLSPEEAESIEVFTPAPVVDPSKKQEPITSKVSDGFAGTIITGVEKITSKQGQGKDKKDKDGKIVPGKPYTIYTIYGEGDTKYTTFDKALADGAKTAQEAGLKVSITTKGDKYNSIDSLDLVEPTEVKDESLPPNFDDIDEKELKF